MACILCVWCRYAQDVLAHHQQHSNYFQGLPEESCREYVQHPGELHEAMMANGEHTQLGGMYFPTCLDAQSQVG